MRITDREIQHFFRYDTKKYIIVMDNRAAGYRWIPKYTAVDSTNSKTFAKLLLKIHGEHHIIVSNPRM